jgi:asparagine synthase (glutamine-hydrolysing)
MCGIVGYTGQKKKDTLEKMTQSIIHRGPNDQAIIENEYFHLGFRRLSIVDLSKNIYPIQNETQTIKLFLNGEIYNYKTLRNTLKKKGHIFNTNSDSEVIVHGYEEWGDAVIEKLRGMFVFTLLDLEKNELLIARDRLGIKPFYYTKFQDHLIFASEIKAIFTGFDVPRNVDELTLFRFLTSRVHDLNDETFFANIKALPRGHFMKVNSKGEFKIKKYWHPKYNPQFNSSKKDREYAEEFLSKFKEAIKIHLIGDVPVGVSLSGGLDSSGITTLSHKIYTEEYKKTNMLAFSAIHPGETVDESEYIDSIVDFTGIESIKVQPQVENFWNDLETWMYYQEEPVISGAPYAYSVVMKEASKKVTVLLSGQGGDELLAGYIPYFLSYFQSALATNNYWSAIREIFMGQDLYFGFILKKFLTKMTRKKNTSSERLLKDVFFQKYNGAQFQFKNFKNLNARLFEDVTTSTTPALLRYEDKNSMSFSLESRVPLLDHELVEYIFNLPIDQKIKFGWNRYVYRNALKNIIPDKNRKRRSKVGFTNPEWEWIERKSDKFKKIFQSDRFKSRPYWNAKQILEDFDLMLRNKIGGDPLYFWRIFITEIWLRQWVDEFKPVKNFS